MSNMFIDFSKAVYLNDEQYKKELAKRTDFLRQNPKTQIVGCPECFQAMTQKPAAGSQ